jgi:hypothetical protein
MQITAVKNPVYSRPDNSMIDCIITCKRGNFPFTAAAQDPETHGKKLYADLLAGKYGPITPYVEIRP